MSEAGQVRLFVAVGLPPQPGQCKKGVVIMIGLRTHVLSKWAVTTWVQPVVTV